VIGLRGIDGTGARLRWSTSETEGVDLLLSGKTDYTAGTGLEYNNGQVSTPLVWNPISNRIGKMGAVRPEMVSWPPCPPNLLRAVPEGEIQSDKLS
jgi:hypothetical protein